MGFAERRERGTAAASQRNRCRRREPNLRWPVWKICTLIDVVTAGDAALLRNSGNRHNNRVCNSRLIRVRAHTTVALSSWRPGGRAPIAIGKGQPNQMVLYRREIQDL